MKNIYTFCLLLIFSGINIEAFTQIDSPVYTHEKIQQIDKNLPKLGQKDFDLLNSVPALTYDKTLINPNTLPGVHDNSTNIYMRPVFHQVSYECGQAAGVGYTFTYEINRLRNLPSNLSANQYPTHFAWNFLNNGTVTGVNCIEAWQIIKGAGTPNVDDYGGMSTGGLDRWMTDYSKYYNGMQNRVHDWAMIECGTPDGLLVLKTWLYNHLENSPYGGLATFYANLQSEQFLPTGTPYGGSSVVTQWAPSVNHCMTIVGYNDSIRYDYNNDGQYTNNIDITGDGIVNMKDWEIGGLKFVNSYGTGYYNQGYCFMMYKTLADLKVDGGIWNNRVMVVAPKQTYEPKLTFKVKLTHDIRNTIKISAGVANDTSSFVPFWTMDFPIFNYQGGDWYMQGGNTIETNKTIEFGLDITSLLNYVNPGDLCKFFLIIDEDDPTSIGTGLLNNFSLIDYSSGILEIPSPQTNVPLTNNAESYFNICKYVTRPVIQITDTVIPPATIYDPYEHQFTAIGGTPPYNWKLRMNYDENVFNENFPSVNAQQLSVTSNDNGYAVKELGFEFPFYGKKYSKVFVHVDGYIMFDDQVYPWPFALDELTMMKSTRNISVYNTRTMVLGSSDGIWYEGNSQYAIFRWKSSIINYTSSTDLNYAVKIYPSGLIEFFYGDITSFDWIDWYAGISEGDMFNNYMLYLSNLSATPLNVKVTLNPVALPTGFEMSSSGLLHGTPEEEYNSLMLNVYVKDNYGFEDSKLLAFSTDGFKIEYSIVSGGDDSLQYGDTAFFDVKLTNISNINIPTGLVKLELNDPYITVTDNSDSFTNLPPSAILTLPHAFSLIVSELIPDNYPVNFTIKTVAGGDTIANSFTIYAYAPKLKLGDVTVIDNNNGALDPGENVDVKIKLVNQGGAKIENMIINMGEWSPDITLNTASDTISLINSYQSGNFYMNIDVSPLVPIGTVVQINFVLTADHQVVFGDEIYFVIGQTGENFETGDFLKYPWQMGGDADWFLTDSLPFEGLWCTQSGNIADDEESFLLVTMNIITNDSLSFYTRISCESDPNNQNYDYLAFQIDGVEQNRWDGIHNWSQSKYMIDAGFKTFKWLYHKDYSVSAGKDAAWIDDIVFPPNGEPLSIINSSVIPDGNSVLISPNPCRDFTTIFYRQSEAGPLKIQIVDLQGKIIHTFVDQKIQPAGLYDYTWRCGSDIKPGIYFFNLTSGKNSISGKLIKIE